MATKTVPITSKYRDAVVEIRERFEREATALAKENMVKIDDKPPAPSTADRLADAIMRLAEEDRGLVRSKLVEMIETCLHGFKGGPLPQDFRLDPASYVTVNGQGQIAKVNMQAGGINLLPPPSRADDWRSLKEYIRWRSFKEYIRAGKSVNVGVDPARGPDQTAYFRPMPVEPPTDPQLYCDTCNNTGETMMMVCYGGPPVERMGSCPDCSDIRKA